MKYMALLLPKSQFTRQYADDLTGDVFMSEEPVQVEHDDCMLMSLRDYCKEVNDSSGHKPSYHDNFWLSYVLIEV